MELLAVFSAFGLAASAGLNAYIPLLVIALVAKFTNLITLAHPWDTLENWWIIGLLGFLVAVEFIADKVPAVNHANDVLMTFIRPVAGAIAFAASTSVLTNINPVFAMAMGLLVAGGVHTVKAAVVRPAVTVATGSAGNVPVSMAEDFTSTVVSIVAIVVPILIGVVMIALAAWLIWRWRRRSQALRTV